MRYLKVLVGIAVTGTAGALFFDRPSAQTATEYTTAPPSHLTGCLDKEGNFKAWNFGLKPVTPCLLRETQVTLVLKAGLDAQAQAGSQADAALRSQIDGVSAARTAGDAALGNDLSTEVAARIAADGGLQTQIAQSEGAIAANAAAILAAENEIGDKANLYANSRLDALSVSSSETLGVIWFSEGGVEDPSNHYRTLVWNPTSGDLALRGEANHGLDYAGGYWYCTVGEQISNGDIQLQVENRPDDHAELSLVGLYESPSAWWAFRFANAQGPNGRSPFARIQVWNVDEGRYVTVEPSEANPVSGWIMGERSHTFGHVGRLRVGLSHSQLRSLINAEYGGFRTATADNHVLVDLNYSVTNLLR